MRLESQQTIANDVPLSDVNKTISVTILRTRSRCGLIMSFVFRCPAYYVRRHVIISASLPDTLRSYTVYLSEAPAVRRRTAEPKNKPFCHWQRKFYCYRNQNRFLGPRYNYFSVENLVSYALIYHRNESDDAFVCCSCS